MDIYLHDTLTGKKEVFVPLQKAESALEEKSNKVSIYNCGPTVYNYAHIGNFRTYVFGDILRRVFEYNGFSVNQVMNITDVDDKTIRDSIKAEISLKKFTRKYEDIFKEEQSEMNILTPHAMPRATESIKDMTMLIEKLLEKEIAYKTNDGVYFSIQKFPEYGALSHLDKSKPQDTKHGHRIATDEYDKENAEDFALWKFHTSEDGDNAWDAPFGKGRPGWHIECSAMAMKALGETIDIHTGATDLIFPHHENEIAQSEAATGKPFVRYWMHAGFLSVDGRKMSKSAHNFYTIPVLKKNDISPLAYRYWLLTAHYRTQVNFTFESVKGADKALQRLLETITEYRRELGKIDEEKLRVDVAYNALFVKAINDDLNTPQAIALVWDLIKDLEITTEVKYATIIHFDNVFGLNLKEHAERKAFSLSTEITPAITELLHEREEARQGKNWDRADELRRMLEEKGFDIKDTPDGQKLIPR